MRVARICNWESPYEPGFKGGMGKNIQQSAEHLARTYGIETDIYTTKFDESFPDVQEAPELPKHVRQIRISVQDVRSTEDIHSLENMTEFAQKVLEFIGKDGGRRPDLVHAHYWPSWQVAQSLSYLGIPHMLQLDQLHMAEKFYFEEEGISFDRGWRLEGELSTIKSADRIVFVSQSQLNDFKRFYSGEDKKEILKKIRVMTNSTDTEFYVPPTEEKKAELKRRHGVSGRTILLYSGRIARDKAINRILESLPRVIDTDSKIMFFVVGRGREEGNLKDLVRQRGALEDHVRFCGYRSGRELLELYQLSDFAALCSIHETFGLSAIEAMSCGLPVVSWRNSGGPEEIIDDNENGFIVDDVEGLSGRIIELERNPEKRRVMGEKGRDKCVKSYNLTRSSGELSSFYLSLVGERKEK